MISTIMLLLFAIGIIINGSPLPKILMSSLTLHSLSPPLNY